MKLHIRQCDLPGLQRPTIRIGDKLLQFTADVKEGILSEGLVMRQLRNPFYVCNTFYLYPASSLTADIHIFARCSYAGAYQSGAAVQEPDIFGCLSQLVGCETVRIGDRLYQRHAQPVCFVYALMAYV